MAAPPVDEQVEVDDEVAAAKPDPSDTSPSPTPPAPFTPIRKVKIFTLAIFAFHLSLVVIFVAYIWSHVVYRVHSTIWVTIPNNTILFISSIFSRIPPLIVSFVMGLAAYGFAADWLMSSSIPNQNAQDNPTPEQYSIALSVIGIASLGAIKSVAIYLYKQRRNQAAMRYPRWLVKSIVFLLLLTATSSLVGLIDLWLHKAALPVRLSTFSTISTPTTQFSRVVNSSLCTEMEAERPPCNSAQLDDASFPQFAQSLEYLLTVTNTSSLNEVVNLPGTSLALLLPVSSLRGNYTYKASTFGVYTTCSPISNECGLNSGRTYYSCPEHPALAGNIHNMKQGTSVRTTFIDSGTQLSSTAIGQPVELGVVATFANVGNANDSQIVPIPSDVWGAYAVILWCEMSFLNVTYIHQPGREQEVLVESYTLTSKNDTYTMSGGIAAGLGTQYIDPFTVLSIVSTNATYFGFTYAQQLSRLALALSAGVTMPSLTLVDYPAKLGIQGSQIPLSSISAFVASMLLFPICVLAVVFYSGTTAGPMLRDGSGSDVHAVALAQSRLTEPGPVIYELFCADKLRRAGCDDLFGSKHEDQDKIRVGVLDEHKLGVALPNESHFGISTSVTRSPQSISGVTVT